LKWIVRTIDTAFVALWSGRDCALALSIIACGVWLAACGTTADDASSGAQAAGTEVPDVVSEDGASATSDLEDAGFTATLVDQAGEERDDGSDCTVDDQEPTGGDEGVEGDEVTVTLDCRQADWDNQEGDVWDEFTVGYESGFADGCDALFGLSPDGSLYEGDIEYTSADCPDPDALGADYPADVPDDPEAEGTDLGLEDGCDAIFNEVALSSELYHGEDVYTADDCKVQAGVIAASHPSPPGQGGTSDGTEECPPAMIGGTVVTVRPISGHVNCRGAAALWKAYVSVAPQQGQGSSAYTEIDGWGCLAAKPPEKPKLGSCSRGDDEFEVYEGTH
jgi:PASTA domain